MTGHVPSTPAIPAGAGNMCSFCLCRFVALVFVVGRGTAHVDGDAGRKNNPYSEESESVPCDGWYFLRSSSIAVY